MWRWLIVFNIANALCWVMQSRDEADTVIMVYDKEREILLKLCVCLCVVGGLWGVSLHHSGCSWTQYEAQTESELLVLLGIQEYIYEL